MGVFLSDCCTLNKKAETTCTMAYAEYKNWCESNGEYVLSQRKFGQALAERGIASRKGTAGVRFYVGIGLLANPSLRVVEGGGYPQVAKSSESLAEEEPF